MGDEPEVDQNLAQLVAALALQLQRAFEILLGNQPALNEDLAQSHEKQLSSL
jgi:hypothetical protein